MTHQTAEICRWCRIPITGTPAWWDGKPQCPDPFACDKRINTREKQPAPMTEEPQP